MWTMGMVQEFSANFFFLDYLKIIKCTHSLDMDEISTEYSIVGHTSSISSSSLSSLTSSSSSTKYYVPVTQIPSSKIQIKRSGSISDSKVKVSSICYI